MTAQSSSTVVHDNAEHQRYEAHEGEHLAGVLGYEDRGGARVLLHTVVEPGMDGHGIGSALARHAIDDAREHDRPIVPVCTFVQGWLTRHPEHADVVAEPPSAR